MKAVEVPEPVQQAEQQFAAAQRRVAALHDRSRILESGLREHERQLQELLERRAGGEVVGDLVLSDLRTKIGDTRDELLGVSGLAAKAALELEAASSARAQAIREQVSAEQAERLRLAMQAVNESHARCEQLYAEFAKELARLAHTLDSYIEAGGRLDGSVLDLLPPNWRPASALILRERWVRKVVGITPHPIEVVALIPPSGLGEI